MFTAAAPLGPEWIPRLQLQLPWDPTESHVYSCSSPGTRSPELPHWTPNCHTHSRVALLNAPLLPHCALHTLYIVPQTLCTVHRHSALCSVHRHCTQTLHAVHTQCPASGLRTLFTHFRQYFGSFTSFTAYSPPPVRADKTCSVQQSCLLAGPPQLQTRSVVSPPAQADGAKKSLSLWPAAPTLALPSR